jgi:phosphotransferase system enzyme I (PtsP)
MPRTSKPKAEATAARIHGGGGDARLDGVLEFVSFVTRPMPLALLLDEAPKKIATIVGADIASLYLLEGEGDALVLRGNVGFPEGARGHVRLSVGEGITGMAVETMRPISVENAARHERFRAFPELDEGRFPVFLAVPVLGHQRPLGAIVVQRAGADAFDAEDVRLLAALTAPIASAVRHAHVLDDLRDKQRRRTGGGTRKVTLPGSPVVRGRALGAVAEMRRPASSPKGEWQPNDVRLLRGAFESAEKSLGALVARARHANLASEAAFLATYLQMLDDSRLRKRAIELVEGKKTIALALSTVAREAQKAANGIVGDAFLRDRARDMEDLCEALIMLASPDARAEIPNKAVLVGDDLTVFDLLVSAKAQPVAVALSDRATGPRTRTLLELLGVPALLDVSGLFKWASPADVALVDADHGFFVINPSRGDIAALRAERRDREDERGEG